ncbi:MAG: 4Fe-4S binding protein [Candidatus Bipolaricaulota bacterium]
MSGRQRVRRAILIVSLLLLPVTFYYFSPYLALAAAAEGAVSGSLVVFGALFLASLLLGRAFCGWACPVGGLGEICAAVQAKPVSRRVNWIKYAIWALWLGGLGLVAVSAGGFRRLDFLYQTVYGLSLVEPAAYAVYAVVLVVVLTLSFAVGRRGFCHAACWMAPFMVVGTKIKSWANWPSLRLRAM